MALIRGLKKLLSKHDRFASPNQYMLTAHEKECVAVFFAVFVLTIVGGSILFIIH